MDGPDYNRTLIRDAVSVRSPPSQIIQIVVETAQPSAAKFSRALTLAADLANVLEVSPDNPVESSPLLARLRRHACYLPRQFGALTRSRTDAARFPNRSSSAHRPRRIYRNGRRKQHRHNTNVCFKTLVVNPSRSGNRSQYRPRIFPLLCSRTRVRTEIINERRQQ